MYLNDVEITNTLSGDLTEWNRNKFFSFPEPTVDVVLAFLGYELSPTSSDSTSGLALECTGAPQWTIFAEPGKGWKTTTANQPNQMPANWYKLSTDVSSFANAVTTSSRFFLPAATKPNKKIWAPGQGLPRYAGLRLIVKLPTDSPTRLPTKLPTKSPVPLELNACPLFCASFHGDPVRFIYACFVDFFLT